MNEDLFEAYLTGRLATPEASEALRTALAQNPRARNEFVAYVLEWERLASTAHAAHTGEAPIFSPSPTTAIQRIASFLRTPSGWWGMMAACLLVGMGVLLWGAMTKRTPLDAIPEVAVVSREGEVVALIDGKPLVLSEEKRLPAMGRLETRKTGTLRLVCEDGTILSLMPETAIAWGKGDVSSREDEESAQSFSGPFPAPPWKTLSIERGILAAEVTPQSSSHSFRIRSRHSEAVVLGTRLRFATGETASLLLVEEGTVGLRRLSDGARIKVRERELVLVTPKDELETVALSAVHDLPSLLDSVARGLPNPGALLSSIKEHPSLSEADASTKATTSLRCRIDLDGTEEKIRLERVAISKGGSTYDASWRGADAPFYLCAEWPSSQNHWSQATITLIPSRTGKVILRLKSLSPRVMKTAEPLWMLYDDVKGIGISLLGGDFESGTGDTPNGWCFRITEAMPAERRPQWILDPWSSRSGRRCVRVWHDGMIEQSLFVEEKKPFTLSFWHRAE